MFHRRKRKENEEVAFLFSPTALLQPSLLVLYVQACSVQKRDVGDFLPRTRSERVEFQDMKRGLEHGWI